MSGETVRPTQHLDERLAELVDGRLSAGDLAQAEAHLAVCAACALRLERARATKRAVATLPVVPLPDGFAASISSALDQEERTSGAGSVVPFPGRAVRPFLAVAALLLVGLAGAFFLSRMPAEIAAAAADFERVRGAQVVLEVPGPSAARLEAFFVSRRLGFETRVFDLGMMGWTIGGGAVGSLDGGPSALWTYRDAKGRVIVCQMYAGLASDVRRGAEVTVRGGITFFVHRRGDLTLVFWQEGDVACALVSDIPREEVVSLAVAKAMLPPRSSPRT
ncbi:MAG: zf-HC2 domain-containing protein [Holophagales bacterium]|nr:zf-HC2 domain-containing protein [Holophagales bacterium]